MSIVEDLVKEIETLRYENILLKKTLDEKNKELIDADKKLHPEKYDTSEIGYGYRQ